MWAYQTLGPAADGLGSERTTRFNEKQKLCTLALVSVSLKAQLNVFHGRRGGRWDTGNPEAAFHKNKPSCRPAVSLAWVLETLSS